MTIDVTTNQQYIDLKGQYDQQISDDETIKQDLQDLKNLEGQLANMPVDCDEYMGISEAIGLKKQDLNRLDPDGSIQKRFNDGDDVIQDTESAEEQQLYLLGIALTGDDAVTRAKHLGKLVTNVDPDDKDKKKHRHASGHHEPRHGGLRHARRDR